MLNGTYKYQNTSATSVTINIPAAPGQAGPGPKAVVIDQITGSHQSVNASAVTTINIADSGLVDYFAIAFTGNATVGKPTAFNYTFPNGSGPRLLVNDTCTLTMATSGGTQGYLSVTWHFENV